MNNKNIFANLRDKQGFTLIEIIVVLVILAILAATAIPTMLGFVEDSRAKVLVTEARTAMIAMQAVTTEAISLGVDKDFIIAALASVTKYSDGSVPPNDATVEALMAYRLYQMLQPDITFVKGGMGLETTENAGLVQADITVVDGKVTSLKYHKLLDKHKRAIITIAPPKAATISYEKVS